MTFTHLINCFALTYAPIYVIYNAKNLGEQKIGSFFSWGIIYYAVATLTKMLLYATVIPYNTIENENYDLSQEFLKILINCIEVAFILMALRNRSSFQESEAHLKVITVGLAWSLSESIFSYFLYFLLNATSEEFKWEYIITAINANIDLLERIAVVALVECYRKYSESSKTNFQFMLLLILKYSVNSLGPKYIPLLQTEDGWMKLGHKLSITLVFALTVQIIFKSIFSGKSKTN